MRRMYNARKTDKFHMYNELVRDFVTPCRHQGATALEFTLMPTVDNALFFFHVCMYLYMTKQNQA